MDSTLTSSVKDMDNGLEARITQRADGRFAVALIDTDANRVLPTVRIFAEHKDALSYARKITD